jgi:hypothetical protein
MSRSQIAIENGIQLGLSSSMLRNNETYFATVAIQKNNDEYIVHIDLILEQNMAMEKYEKYETHAFSSLQSAISFLLKMSPISIGDISELKPFKGQKGFNVEAEEIIRAFAK